MDDRILQQIQEEIRLVRSAIGDVTRNGGILNRRLPQDPSANDPHYYTNKVKKVTTEAVDSIQAFGSIFSKSTDDAVTTFTKTVREHFTIFGVALGAAMAAPIDYFHGMTKVYKDLANVGQSFSGDIFALGRAAAEAGMGTDQYAKVIKENSVSISQLGRENFGELSKNVWQTNKNFTDLQISLDDQNEQTITWLETERRQKRLGTMDNAKASSQMQALTKNASDLSIMFGANRIALFKATEDAMREPLLLGKTLQMTNSQMDDYSQNMRIAIQTLAAQPGEIGKVLPMMLAQTAGAGSGIFSDFGKKLIETGLSPIVSVMDNYANKLGDSTLSQSEIVDAGLDALKQSEQYIGSQLPMLKAQAMAGNHTAAEMITLYSEMQKDPALMKARLEQSAQTNKMKNAMMGIEASWVKGSAKVREAIFDKLGIAVEWISKKIEAMHWDKVELRIQEWSGKLDTWFADFFKDFDSDAFMKSFMDTVETIGKGLGDFATWISKWNKDDLKVGAEAAGALFLAFFVGIGNIVGVFTLLCNAVTAFAGGIGGALATFATFVLRGTGAFAGFYDAIVVAEEIINRFSKTSEQNNTIDNMEKNGKLTKQQAEKERIKNVVANVAGGEGEFMTAASGALIGGIVGSIFPVVGTAVGALIGGMAGHIYGKLTGLNKIFSEAFEGFTRWFTGARLDADGKDTGEKKGWIDTFYDAINQLGSFILDIIKKLNPFTAWDNLTGKVSNWFGSAPTQSDASYIGPLSTNSSQDIQTVTPTIKQLQTPTESAFDTQQKDAEWHASTTGKILDTLEKLLHATTYGNAINKDGSERNDRGNRQVADALAAQSN